MSNVECPLEVGRLNCVEEPVRFGDVMRDVVDFGVFWFLVVVLEEDDDLRLFCSVYQSLNACDSGIPALCDVPEMVAAVSDEPTASESLCQC